jgi:hypothetical protein
MLIAPSKALSSLADWKEVRLTLNAGTSHNPHKQILTIAPNRLLSVKSLLHRWAPGWVTSNFNGQRHLAPHCSFSSGTTSKRNTLKVSKSVLFHPSHP